MDSETWDVFADIAVINTWLDRSNASMNSEHDDSMRVMKIGEEFGEAVAAYIGMTGQNPRKGVTHTQADLLAELADVAVTALAAIQHFTGNPVISRAVMASKIAGIMKRAKLSGVPNAAEIPALIDITEAYPSLRQ
jgi:hypothetical protein